MLVTKALSYPNYSLVVPNTVYMQNFRKFEFIWVCKVFIVPLQIPFQTKKKCETKKKKCKNAAFLKEIPFNPCNSESI